MSLQNRTCMEELFALLGKASAVIYDDDELNEAVNYALALENDERIFCMQDITGLLNFLFAMKPIMEKMQVWNNNNLRLLRLWIMRSVLIVSCWKK